MINDSNTLRKPLAMVAAAVLAAAMAVAVSLSLGAGKAWAVDWPAPHIEDLGGKTYAVSQKQVLFGNHLSYQSVKHPKWKITGAKSSNPAVASVSTYNGSGMHTLSVSVHSAGTTNITYKFGSKKHTVKYTVKPYVNPLKSFKIGSKNYKSKFNPKNITNDSGEYARGSVVTTGFSGKINVKLNSGWTLKKVYTLDKSAKVGGKVKVSKNGAKVNKAVCVWLVVKNKKTKVNEILYLTADSKKINKMITAGSF